MQPKNETIASNLIKKGDTSKPSENPTPIKRGEPSKEDPAKRLGTLKDKNLPTAATAGSSTHAAIARPALPESWDLHKFTMFGFNKDMKPVEYNASNCNEFAFVSIQHLVLLTLGGGTV